MEKFSIHVSETLKNLPREVRRTLHRRLRRIARAANLSAAAKEALCVRIVDDVEMAELHRLHMGIDGPTDVLSFPAQEGAFEADALGAGDIALNWAQIRRQARAGDLDSALDEASVLLVHGFAHLLGHDHRTRGEGRRMHRLERALLGRIGVADIPRSYGLPR
ncbi:MAG: rRNA maturation RNase YbeY [Nannocystaceae bacterium]